MDEQTLIINTKIWKLMFDHVINPIVEHVRNLLKEHEEIEFKYLCLVGGLSCSSYFKHKIEEEFGKDTKYDLTIMTTKNPLLSVVKGAAYFAKHPNYIH